MLCENKSISVKNFGTLNPYLFHSHKGLNIGTGEIEIHPEFWTAKFHTHSSFDKLLNDRRKKFKKAKKRS